MHIDTMECYLYCLYCGIPAAVWQVIDMKIQSAVGEARRGDLESALKFGCGRLEYVGLAIL